MQHFNFTCDEISRHSRSMRDWHAFVRRREAEIAFSLMGETRFSQALEIGAGDGGQSVTIAKFCDHLVCTEVDENSHDWLGGRRFSSANCRTSSIASAIHRTSRSSTTSPSISSFRAMPLNTSRRSIAA